MKISKFTAPAAGLCLVLICSLALGEVISEKIEQEHSESTSNTSSNSISVQTVEQTKEEKKEEAFEELVSNLNGQGSDKNHRPTPSTDLPPETSSPPIPPPPPKLPKPDGTIGGPPQVKPSQSGSGPKSAERKPYHEGQFNQRPRQPPSGQGQGQSGSGKFGGWLNQAGQKMKDWFSSAHQHVKGWWGKMTGGRGSGSSNHENQRPAPPSGGQQQDSGSFAGGLSTDVSNNGGGWRQHFAAAKEFMGKAGQKAKDWFGNMASSGRINGPPSRSPGQQGGGWGQGGQGQWGQNGQGRQNGDDSGFEDSGPQQDQSFRDGVGSKPQRNRGLRWQPRQRQD